MAKHFPLSILHGVFVVIPRSPDPWHHLFSPYSTERDHACILSNDIPPAWAAIPGSYLDETNTTLRTTHALPLPLRSARIPMLYITFGIGHKTTFASKRCSSTGPSATTTISTTISFLAFSSQDMGQWVRFSGAVIFAFVQQTTRIGRTGVSSLL